MKSSHSSSLKPLVTCIMILFATSLIAQSNNEKYTCENSANTFLEKTLGNWRVITKDRTSPGVYESNYGTSTITQSIEGCGIKESYRGTYRNKVYAREVVITGSDSSRVQMSALDSEHGSFSILNGTVEDSKMTLYWYRDIQKKRLQSKYKLEFKDESTFEFSSFLSTDYGENWALTHQRIYHKIKHEEVTIVTKDSIKVFGDLYTIDKKSPTILLFHQGGSNSRAEYKTIIPKLNNEGYNVLSIDQRVGGSYFYGGHNRTVARLEKRGYNYCDAYPDMEATLDYLVENGYNGKRIAWGSSYSASLAVKLANNNPNKLDGVLAFSPASGDQLAECRADNYFKTLKLPLLLLRPKSEMQRDRSVQQISLAKDSGHKTYVAENGVHGSSMLVKDRVEGSTSKQWNVVLNFLNELQ
ncbi:alpha/beta hydrolase [Winogradskyella sp. 3972H.M.0a.05]|uniref:alpha/beta hydrolase n=1 Tax=Winogradskyella sp. 3972H.M.0a.05 TaxID=2950277 RepID=UPI003396D6EE